MKTYLYHNLVALDQLFNALTGGAADETLSSRAYRLSAHSKKWRRIQRSLDALFFWQKAHCYGAYLSELHRKQYPTDFPRHEQGGTECR